MKRNYIIAILAVFVLAVVAPLNTMAKDKKVKYLGHTYKGGVDSNKIPNGNGVLTVDRLQIEGIFDSNSAIDAEVCKVDLYGSGRLQLAKFYGGVTFDESDNITLKSGGKMVFYYLDWYSKKTKEMTEILSEDRLVNSSNFEPNEIKIKYTIKPKDVSSVLNPPTEATGYYTLTLQDYSYEDKWQIGSQTGSRMVRTHAFIDLTNEEKETKMKIVNYKDGEGRIWNWESKPRIKWSVNYPDGSYYKSDANKSQYAFYDSWKICFPDGNTVEYNPSSNDQFGCLSLGGSFFLINHGLNKPEGFVKLKSLGKLCFTNSNPEFGVYSNYYDFESLSSQEGEKLIKEHVLPYLKSESADKTVSVKVMSGNSMGDRTLGIYRDGKYLSEAERKAKEKEKAEKEFKRNYANACKMYGKTYVDAALNGKVIIGMPEKLFLSIFTNCQLHAQTAEGKLYRIYSYATKSRGNKEWLAEVLSKEVIIYNGKVAKILNYR